MTDGAPAAIGQVWEDMDPRCKGRQLLVVGFKGDAVVCRVISSPDRPAHVGQVRMIQPHRLRPWRNGYRLVGDQADL